ncbi:hypothetical protein L6452_01322 [Arctium lappa]|uniref:Uncharacterized protein n=1 Tax=Arctium lappa TaxID=4217 RepID=A0ACB9FGK6_ARCLA|nr:hypothetical protein L6452_01322 [Arctium lappa]
MVRPYLLPVLGPSRVVDASRFYDELPALDNWFVDSGDAAIVLVSRIYSWDGPSLSTTSTYTKLTPITELSGDWAFCDPLSGLTHSRSPVKPTPGLNHSRVVPSPVTHASSWGLFTCTSLEFSCENFLLKVHILKLVFAASLNT